MKHEKFETDRSTSGGGTSAPRVMGISAPGGACEANSNTAETLLLKSKPPRQPSQSGLTGLSIRRAETRQRDTRRHSRQPVQNLRAHVLYGSRAIEVELLNLSGGGAMIGCDLQPNIADTLRLHFEERDSVECLVRWLKGGRIGLEFAHETELQCTEAEQLSVLSEVVRCNRPDQLIEVSEQQERPDVRAGFRHPLIWSGELVYLNQRRKVRLRNVSAGGALVEGRVSPRIGSEVLLDLGGAGLLPATVKWAAGDCAGLQFDRQFDLASLARSKPRLVPATWLRPAYLEKVVPETSGWDKGWNRMSLGEVREQLEGFLKH